MYRPAPLSGVCTQTFGAMGYPPRFGWLHKAVHAVRADPAVFSRADVAVRLGMGSSMARSARAWALAFKLVAPAERDGHRTGALLQPTARGLWLLDEDGADPYLEEAASLSLLHWWLLSPPVRVPVWWTAFAWHGMLRFTRRELHAGVLSSAADAGWTGRFAATARRDVDCLARMYAGERGERDDPRPGLSDLFDHPFRQLGLLHQDESGHLVRSPSSLHAVPPPVLAYACLDFAHRTGGNRASSIALHRLAGDAGSPGQVMHLDAARLRRDLERAAAGHPALAIVESAGTVALIFAAPPLALAREILSGHYAHAPAVPEDCARTPQAR